MTPARENDEARFGIINSRFFGSSAPAPGEIVYSAGLSAMHTTIRQGLMEAIKRFDDFGDNTDHDRGEPVYRLCEPNGTVCDCWLPGLEDPDHEGPLDRNGFDEHSDAQAFKLGVDWIRAEAGLLPGVTVADIDREREALDSRAPITATPEPVHIPPVIDYRRRVA